MNIEYRMSKEGFLSILSKKIDSWIESTVRPFITDIVDWLIS
jgi:hypothetical protein